MSYVMLGSLQSDPLESRFGWWRQMCGSSYCISERHAHESHRKIQALSLLKFSGFDVQQLQTLREKNAAEATSLENRVVQEAKVIAEKVHTSPPVTADHADSNAVFYVTGG